MNDDSLRAMLQLLARSVREGHWRVACRRYLMLQACAGEVPAHWRAQCEQLLQRCSARDLQRMRRDAGAWAAMVRPPAPRSAAACAITAAAEMIACDTPAAVTPPPAARPLRTEWRPLPRFLRDGPHA